MTMSAKVRRTLEMLGVEVPAPQLETEEEAARYQFGMDLVRKMEREEAIEASLRELGKALRLEVSFARAVIFWERNGIEIPSRQWWAEFDERLRESCISDLNRWNGAGWRNGRP